MNDLNGTNALDALDPQPRAILAQVIGEHDQGLLVALSITGTPSREQRIAVERIMGEELEQHFNAQHQPDQHAAPIQDALEAFLERYPIEPDDTDHTRRG